MTRARGLLPAGVDSPAGLSARLAQVRYLADVGLATAAYLGLRLHRPLFCEGEAGVGKTELAKALATVLDAPLIRLQCYEGIDASQALYDWDFPRQLLHLRTAEATGAAGAGLEEELYDRRFLIARPLLAALGAHHLDPALAAATLGAVVKYREDAERALAMDMGALVERAVAGA